MKYILGILLTFVSLGAFAAGEPTDSVEPFNAVRAFRQMPSATLDLLTPSMRLDLVDYYRADSIYRVQNALEGLSYLHRPLTDSYLKVQITPVTTLTIRILPAKRGRPIAATVYTIGDSLQSADSDLRFYDERMTELKRSKFIPDTRVEDFFNFGKMKREERKQLLDLVPFPTVEFTLSPDSTDLTATLTAEGFLSKEAYDRLKPYLIPTRTYRWNGGKYRLVHHDAL